MATMLGRMGVMFRGSNWGRGNLIPIETRLNGSRRKILEEVSRRALCRFTMGSFHCGRLTTEYLY
jgi:hypothetical protein